MIKLIDYAKNKVKYADFTQLDKYNLLDMFVNNPTTYEYLYKSIFPNKLAERFQQRQSKEGLQLRIASNQQPQ